MDPTIQNQAQPERGPWYWLQPKYLATFSLAGLIVVVGLVQFSRGFFQTKKETAAEQAERQTQQQYEQTTPPAPGDISQFGKRTEQSAAEIAQQSATAANLAKLMGGANVNPGVPTAANPLAVPGNPMNTDPALYKQWADADATVRQAALAAPGGMNPPPAPGTVSGNAENAKTTLEQKRDEARQRDEERRTASMVVIDFTQSEAKPEAKAETPAGKEAAPVVNTTATADKKEPIPLPEHFCFDLCEGDHLDTVLVNRLDGAAPGYVDVEVVEPVFSHGYDPKGRRLLIPVGSRALGDVFSVGATHQERLYVAFHKLRRPDGSTFSLDNLKGLDQAGAAGLHDKVDNHLVSKIATAGAMAALGTLTQINNVGAYGGLGGYDWGVQMRNGLTSQIGQEGMQLFQQKLNQLPSLTAREGKVLVKVYLSNDYTVSEYALKPGRGTDAK